MPRKVSIFRLNPDAHAAPAHLSKRMGRPMSKLVSELVEDYLLKNSKAEREVEGVLASFCAYRERTEPTQGKIARGKPDSKTIGAAGEFVRLVACSRPAATNSRWSRCFTTFSDNDRGLVAGHTLAPWISERCTRLLSTAAS
jgi:hypothetical protein